MRKLSIYLLVFALITLVTFIAFVTVKKKYTKINDMQRMYFSYSTGTMIYSNVRYEINQKRNKYVITIKPDNVPDEEKKEVEVGFLTINKIIDVLNEYKVYNWDGFRKYDRNVLDGNSFSFSLYYGNNKKVEANGYMMYPKNYREVREKLDNIFTEIYNKN